MSEVTFQVGFCFARGMGISLGIHGNHEIVVRLSILLFGVDRKSGFDQGKSMHKMYVCLPDELV